MVAESTEILAPMSQLGCAIASRGVTAAMASRERSRNGPPEAVRMRRSTVSVGFAPQRLEDRIVLGVHRQQHAPLRRTSSISSAPAQTRHSLVASATIAPRRIAVRVGPRPAAPTIAAMTQSAGRSAASIRPASPQAASMPLPASASHSAG